MSNLNDSVASQLAEACASGCSGGAQVTEKALRYQWAWEAIAILNRMTLVDSVRAFVDMSRAAFAEIICYTMTMATDPESLVYALGPHPLLLQRILEAIQHIEDPSMRAAVISQCSELAKTAAQQHKKSDCSLLFQLAEIVFVSDFEAATIIEVDPREVAEDTFFRHSVSGREQTDRIRVFLDEKGHCVRGSVTSGFPEARSKVVLFVLQRDSQIPTGVAYGSQRITMEVAKRVKRAGYQVALVGCSKHRIGTTEGLLFLGCRDDLDVLRCVRLLRNVDATVGVSRGDALAVSHARRAMVYHHGPHPVQGVRSNAILRRFKTPVVCLSRSSARQQVGFGLREDQTTHVYSGFDRAVFGMAAGQIRDRHRITFAGNIADYKGTDIAVRAFELLRNEFPDVCLDIYGSNDFNWRKWLLQDSCLFEERWLHTDGTLDSELLEKNLPGLKYRGQVDSAAMAQAYRRSSLLIMPSRVPETFGLVSSESQACGCIPVLPRNGAFPETMIEGKTGYLYEPNTPEALASTIRDLWFKELPCERQRHAAAQTVKDNFSWDKTGDGVLAVLRNQKVRSRLTRTFMYWHWLFDALLLRYGSVFRIVKALTLRPFRSKVGSR